MSFLFREFPEQATTDERKWFGRARTIARGGVALMGTGVGLALVSLPTKNIDLMLASLGAEIAGGAIYASGMEGMRRVTSNVLSRPMPTQTETLPLEFSPEN